MKKDNQNKFQVEKIKKHLNVFQSTIRRVFPHIVVELALFSVIFLSCFVGRFVSIATNITEKDGRQNVFDQLQNAETSQKVDFELNTDTPDMNEDVDQNTNNDLTENVKYYDSQMCIIGDDRMIGMQNALFTNAHFIVKSSGGVDWFNQTACVEFENIQKDIKICVVALGVCDINRANDYISAMNRFADKYPDTLFVYLTVGPVDESKYSDIKNSDIEVFNQSLTSQLSEKWSVIDQYQHLISNEFNTNDGFNYGHVVYAEIFAWMTDSLSIQVNDQIN